MTSGLFVTGTDTDIGKTVAGVALLQALGRQGRRCAAMKPVASGCRRTPEGLRNDDALALQGAAGVEVDYAWLNPFAYEPAIAPHIAAREAGRAVDLDVIAAAHARIARLADLVVVEGAGGWLVPLDERHVMADLAQRLGLDVVLVVGMRLGCINHALLSAESIERRGLRLAGWIANCPGPEQARLDDNLRALDARMPCVRLGTIPFFPHGPPADLGGHVDVAPLFRPR